MQLVDTHCHLISEPLKHEASSLIKRAQEAGISKIINIACDLDSSLLALEQLELSTILYAALGIQPHDVANYTPDVAEKISKLAQDTNRVVGIGEIGLDAYFESTKATLSKQKECFEHFLNIACVLDLPVVVHVRNTHNEVYHLISQYVKKGLRGVIHCFTGTQDEAKQFLDCGFFISFAGIATFKNAVSIADVAAFIPNDKILIETDSPYLAPVPMRGKINEPGYLAHTCRFLAEKRGVSFESFAELTYANSHILFNKLNG